MNNQAEVTAAMQGIDDAMEEMWKSIRYNDTAIDSERVEATFVLNVTEAHANLMEALKTLRAAYAFYAQPAPVPANKMKGCTLDTDSTPLEQQNPSND